MNKEIWRTIEGYNGMYQVSNLGNVKSLRFGKERVLKTAFDNNGYHRLGLYKDGKVKKWYVHRLVCEAFIPNPDDKPCIDHINTDRTDNRVENLRWATVKENQNNPLTILKRKVG